MTKPNDWEGAIKAAMVVAKCSAPPFRYQVVDNINPEKPVAITLTAWAAQVLADEMNKRLPGGGFLVFDMDGAFIAPGQIRKHANEDE